MEENTRARNCLPAFPARIYVARHREAPQSPATRLPAELEAQGRKRRTTNRYDDAQTKIQRHSARIIFDAPMSARIYRLI